MTKYNGADFHWNSIIDEILIIGIELSLKKNGFFLKFFLKRISGFFLILFKTQHRFVSFSSIIAIYIYIKINSWIDYEQNSNGKGSISWSKCWKCISPNRIEICSVVDSSIP